MAIRGAGGKRSTGGGRRRVSVGDHGGVVNPPKASRARTRNHEGEAQFSVDSLVGMTNPSRGQSFGGQAGGTAVQIKKG